MQFSFRVLMIILSIISLFSAKSLYVTDMTILFGTEKESFINGSKPETAVIRSQFATASRTFAAKNDDLAHKLTSFEKQLRPLRCFKKTRIQIKHIDQINKDATSNANRLAHK